MPKIEIDVIVIEKKKIKSSHGNDFFLYKGIYKGKDTQEVAEWFSDKDLPLNQSAKVDFYFGKLRK